MYEKFVYNNRWRFSGYYKGEWINKSWLWASSLGLFDISLPDIDFEFKKLEENSLEILGLGKIFVQKGVISKLLSLENYDVVKFPKEIEEISKNGIVVCTKDSNIYQSLRLESNEKVEADNEIFFTYYENKNIFVVSSYAEEKALELYSIFMETVDTLKRYDIVKGWPYYTSGYYTITQKVENPIISVSKAIKQGCKWMFLIGPYENLTAKELRKWLNDLGLNFVTITGQASSDGKVVMLDMERYPSYQGSNYKVAYKWYKENGGYLFARFVAYDILDDIPKEDLSGFIFEEGNSQFIEQYDDPFLIFKHLPRMEEIPASMFVLIPKTAEYNKGTLIKSILERRCIGVFPPNHIVGPKKLLRIFSFLFIEKDFLDSVFGRKIYTETYTSNGNITIKVVNTRKTTIKGNLRIKTINHIALDKKELYIELAPLEEKIFEIPYKVLEVPENNIVPIGIFFDGEEFTAYDLNYISIPDVISLPQQLFRYSNSVIAYATIYNIGDKEKVPIHIEVYNDKENIYSKDIIAYIPPQNIKDISFSLSLKPGEYTVFLKTLGKEASFKIIVNEPKGKVTWYKADYDKDGLEEIIIENEKIRVVILPWGGRIIRFTLKDRDQDVLFKIWPKRPLDWRSADRKSQYWPYGGLEEFINYPTVFGHIPFNLEIVNSTPNSITIEASVEKYGNRFKKLITVFGQEPLVEVVYMLHAKNPELNVLGVNPLIRIGGSCNENHIFIFPTKQGIEKRRFMKTNFYGEFFDLSEGWVAGYDEEERITLVTLFPPDVPYVTHLWMNTPRNIASQHYYVEVQPWIKIHENNPLYFTYYLYTDSETWEKTVSRLRKMKLISKKK